MTKIEHTRIARQNQLLGVAVTMLAIQINPWIPVGYFFVVIILWTQSVLNYWDNLGDDLIYFCSEENCNNIIKLGSKADEDIFCFTHSMSD